MASGLTMFSEILPFWNLNIPVAAMSMLLPVGGLPMNSVRQIPFYKFVPGQQFGKWLLWFPWPSTRAVSGVGCSPRNSNQAFLAHG